MDIFEHIFMRIFTLPPRHISNTIKVPKYILHWSLLSPFNNWRETKKKRTKKRERGKKKGEKEKGKKKVGKKGKKGMVEEKGKGKKGGKEKLEEKRREIKERRERGEK